VATNRVAGGPRDARIALEEYNRWLTSPPPSLALPGRFTQNWIEANVPLLHPGQVPALMAELRARGWTDDWIAQRVRPFIANHSR
jgi:hypothetical protein